jgi:hypothetical protein
MGAQNMAMAQKRRVYSIADLAKHLVSEFRLWRPGLVPPVQRRNRDS